MILQKASEKSEAFVFIGMLSFGMLSLSFQEKLTDDVQGFFCYKVIQMITRYGM